MLMLAAEKGYTEIIDDILNYGPDIDARDKYGKNALFYAIESNCENSDIASRLIEKGINVDCQANDKSTPLLKAIEKGYLEIARLLLKNKAFTHYVNDNGGCCSLKSMTLLNLHLFRYVAAYCCP